MSNYIPRHTKKRHRLHRVVRDLLSAVGRSEPAERILKLAEEARQAEIRALRAERAQASRSESGADARAKLDLRILALESAPIEEVLERHGVRLKK